MKRIIGILMMALALASVSAEPIHDRGLYKELKTLAAFEAPVCADKSCRDAIVKMTNSMDADDFVDLGMSESEAEAVFKEWHYKADMLVKAFDKVISAAENLDKKVSDMKALAQKMLDANDDLEKLELLYYKVGLMNSAVNKYNAKVAEYNKAREAYAGFSQSILEQFGIE